MRAAAARSRTTDNHAAIFKAGELVEATYPPGLSTAASKALILMLHAAGHQAGEDRLHSIPKTVLRGSHVGTKRLKLVLEELFDAAFRFPALSPAKKAALRSVRVLEETIEEIADDNRAMFYWRFSRDMRTLIASSNYYAELRRQTVLALESRYSIRLYGIGAAYYRRRDPVWEVSVAELRSTLGVPEGRLPRWVDVRRVALEPAVAEINQLAHFEADWTPITSGQQVTGVRVRFWAKHPQDVAAAEVELAASRVGRRARRDEDQRIVENHQASMRDVLRAEFHANKLPQDGAHEK
jgi:plasmid replication initiation protein